MPIPNPPVRDFLNDDVLGSIISYLDHEVMSKFIQAIKDSLDRPILNGRHILSGRFAYNTIKKRRDLSFKLVRAVEHRSLRRVEALLLEGADPNLGDMFAPLDRALYIARYNNHPIIQALLDRGADPLRGLQALDQSLRLDDDLPRRMKSEIEIQLIFSVVSRPGGMQLLTDSRTADWRSQLVRSVLDGYGVSPVTGSVAVALPNQIKLSVKLAVLKGEMSTLSALINTLQPNERLGLVQEAAGFAARLGQSELALALAIEYQVDREQLICAAAATCDAQLVSSLLPGDTENYTMPINVFNVAMESAAYAGNSSVVQCLLDRLNGQSPLLPSDEHDQINWQSFVCAAARHAHSDVLPLLEPHARTQDQMFSYYYSGIEEALSDAVKCGDCDVVRCIIGEHPHYKDVLIRGGVWQDEVYVNPDVFKYLVSQAKEHSIDLGTHDLITWAARHGNLDLFAYLLDQMPENYDSSTLIDALKAAACWGKLNIVTYLLNKNVLNEDSGENALKNAVNNGHSEVVDELLAYGAHTPGFLETIKDLLVKHLVVHCIFVPLCIVTCCMINPSLFFAVCGMTAFSAAQLQFWIGFCLSAFRIFLPPLFISMSEDDLYSLTGEGKMLLFITLLASGFLFLYFHLAFTAMPFICVAYAMTMCLVTSIYGAVFSKLLADSIYKYIMSSSISLPRACMAACGFYKTKSPDEVSDPDHEAPLMAQAITESQCC